MRTSRLIMTLVLFYATAWFMSASAQLQAPAPSPAASVSQVVGFTKIDIKYSSPGVKGREVFGGIVPFGTPWRAGANAATTITFSTNVKIGSSSLRAGTYSIFIKPEESGDWSIHLNKEAKSVYAYMKDGKIDGDALAKDDAVVIKSAPEKLGSKMERLAYHISAGDNKKATISMAWDDMKVSFEVDAMVDEMMERIGSSFK